MKKFFKSAGIAVALSLAAAAGAFAAQGANTLNYMEQGGAVWDVGGTLKFNPGGSFTSDKATATANSGNSYAVTANAMSGVITTDSLSTAAGSSQTITISDSEVTTSSVVNVGLAGGTDTAGTPVIVATPGSGSITIKLYNKHASAAFSGTFVLDFLAT
jgi:hypothetical protein